MNVINNVIASAIFTPLLPILYSLTYRLVLVHQIMAEIQNSNPTILNAADLPTRLRPTATRKSEYSGGIFTSALPLAPVDFESAPSSDSDDDNLLEEPIDEQEIYGKKLEYDIPGSPLSHMFLGDGC